MTINSEQYVDEKIHCVFGGTTNGNTNMQCSIEVPHPETSVVDVLITLAPLLTVLVAVLTMLYTISKYRSDSRFQRKAIKREKNKEHKAEQLEKIEKFYGPMKALREESFVLYQYFALEEKRKLEAKEKNFRTLRYLTQRTDSGKLGIDKFAQNDQSILRNILEISDQNLALIENHGGYVDNPALHELLGKLAAHFRALKIAAEGELEGMSDELEGIVFPKEIDGAIENEIRKIQAAIQSNKKRKKYKPNKTIKYYDNNYQAYSLKTRDTDLTDIYDRFTRVIPKGAKILDAGCGAGRDTKYFIQKGYKVTSFDGSKKMAEMCNQYPFAYCEVIDFCEINYGQCFDAVWASASLLHLNPSQLKLALERLWQSLKKEGHFYLSLKQEKSPNSDSREYFIHNEDDIEQSLVNQLKMTLIDEWESTSSINKTEIFTNYIFKK